MLSTLLKTTEPTKFILIQDSFKISGKKLLHYLIRQHINEDKHEIHFFAFETPPAVVKKVFPSPKVVVHDFITDSGGWIDRLQRKDFIDLMNSTNAAGVVVIDSLSHPVFHHGIGITSRILQRALKSEQYPVVQMIALLHQDVLENRVQNTQCLEYLSTLNVVLERPRKTVLPTATYSVKKNSGKVSKHVEEFYFENDVFLTKAIEKAIPKLPALAKGPEEMSTFKISVEDAEKKAKDSLVLPHVKSGQKDGDANPGTGDGGGGKIFYDMEEADDWDEEDPDDDLDI